MLPMYTLKNVTCDQSLKILIYHRLLKQLTPNHIGYFATKF